MLGELYYRIWKKSEVYGLSGGIFPTVGIGGHLSSTGYGNMLSKHGLTIDHLIDAKLVDAKGRVLDTKAMGEDLFLAIRDGGGNLRLSYNNLTGSLLGSLGNSDIQNFWLNNQKQMLLGRIDVLSSTTQLSQVWLHANAFSGSISDLSNCSNLFDLQLRDNQFTRMVPPCLIRLPKLFNITLQNNKLQGPYPLFSSSVQVTIGNTNSFCKDTSGPCDPHVTAFLDVTGAIGYPMSLANAWKGNDACNGWRFLTCDSQGKNVTIVNMGK
ncbi:Serine/threonine protein kinase [Forsythia ovata]|uniref:Serine/threonine protein kinase n=1 Tax=Forsythia ovata TaxID=205694 RepID=A0ABD1TTR2_9LAMI